ncbi:hypothetical protein C9374_000621 [Naegleria lovaniensis]|uniref:RNA helicase n=1 Tax=Naegleria lovaniensis TaxID=51637 RepID=A0AA88GWQ9_NAELO|nr:uncharacterized protein C9374_000621 [Naegleria lovaniensis]KAG2388457.1 hypothetical protein C9374_000621 [Naegleria lovaniensis]
MKKSQAKKRTHSEDDTQKKSSNLILPSLESSILSSERPVKKVKETSSTNNANNSKQATVNNNVKDSTKLLNTTSEPSSEEVVLSKDLQKQLPFDPHFADSNAPSSTPTTTDHSKQKRVKSLPQKSRRKQKSEERKKKKVEEKKAKEAMRQQLIESHKKHTLQDDQLKVLKPTRQLGTGSETTKQELEKLAIYEKLGIKENAAPKADKFWKKRNPELVQERWNEEGMQLVNEDSDEMEIYVAPTQLQENTEGENQNTETLNRPQEEKKPLMVLDFFGTGNVVSNIPQAVSKKVQEEAKKKEEEKESLFYDSDDDPTKGIDFEVMGKTYDELIDDMLEKLDNSKTDEEKEVRYTRFYVTVNRKPEIQDQRMLLPICGEEQRIMETINDNEITIVKGETGSGKTTQIPQFLYEYGYGCVESGFPGIIGVTQPRRVAAVSTAKRVAEELNVVFGEEVAYQVRFDKNVSTEKTKIKFMTDGILMREIQSDPLLLNYSVIALDEIHERNVNTDILIGWLSRFIPQRNRMAAAKLTTPEGKPITPLKLIIMSATLQLESFTDNTKLFPVAPPVVDVQSRQYPVVVHFNKRTVFNDYVEAAYKKAVKIHENLPNGGILIFLTGRKEIEYLVERLKKYSDKRFLQIKKKEMLRKQQEEEKEKTAQEEEELINLLGDLSDSDDEDEGSLSSSKKSVGLKEEDNMFDEENEEPTEEEPKKNDKQLEEEEKNGKSETVVLFQDNITNEKLKKKGEEHNQKLNRNKKSERLHVLPLYAMLQPQEQMKVFNNPPPGHRLVVVATNVAETSLTIPNIRYVIDCGRIKEKHFEKSTGIFKFQIGWTSQASANQRAGRAGRTGPGHCYRMFSSAVFDQRFLDYTEPDILKAPIENIILQMKSMGIKQVEKFPFPTPPDVESVKKGVDVLVNLGALDKYLSNKDGTIETIITKMGTAMNRFPLHPRFAKMLILSKTNTELLQYVAGVVSVMTVQQIFMHDNHLTILKEKIEKRKQQEMKEKLQRLGMKSDVLDANKKLTMDREEIEEQQAVENFEDQDSMTDEAKKEEELYLNEQEQEMKVKCKEIKKLWSHPLSDHLAMLKAVGAYLFSEEPQEFCMEYMLHQKNMREVRKLYRQLLNTVKSELKVSALELDSDETEVENNEDNDDETDTSVQTKQQRPQPLPFPEPKDDEDEQFQVETAIRQVICAGMVDQVARLATVEDLAHMDVSYRETSKPYVTLSLGRSVPVFIHPSSCLFGRHPEYVIFTELTKSRKNKTYMRGVTAVEPNWISRFGNSKCGFVKHSDPLDSPPPFYDAQDDCVKCFIRPTIHQSSTGVVWTLPIEDVEFKHDGSKQVQVFGKAILEGKVFSSIKLSKEHLINLPTIIQSKRFLDFTLALKTLFKKGLGCCKEKLVEHWKSNPTYLRNELTQLLGVQNFDNIRWPPNK